MVGIKVKVDLNIYLKKLIFLGSLTEQINLFKNVILIILEEKRVI